VIDKSDLQRKKHNPPITVTEAGRGIDVKPLSENAEIPNPDNCEPASIVIDKSDLQPKKHDSPITVTEAGR
jgi:desulfoferrodoxin (superoxide reductase-like protein)